MPGWQDAPVMDQPPASPAVDPNGPPPQAAGGPAPGLVQDQQNPNWWRDQTGQVAYIGQPNPPPTVGPDGSTVLDITGTSNLDAIAAMTGQRPTAPVPSPQAPPPSPGDPGFSDPGGWANAPVVGDTPQMTHARQDAQALVDQSPGWERAIANGATFNTAERWIAPGIAAGETGVHNWFAHLTGQPDSGYSMSDAFTALRDADKAADAQFQQQHPGQNLAGNILGAVANPIGGAVGHWIGEAPSLMGAVARSIPAGGLLGAAYGAGGSDPEHMLQDAISGGVLGAMTGPIAPVLGGLLGPVVRPVQRALSNLTADAIPAARGALNSLNVGWNDLRAGAQDQIQQLIGRGANPADAAVTTAARTLPVPVPLSMGQITADPAQQLAENLALRGAKGPDAATFARQFRDDQQQALRDNVSTIAGGMNGGQPVAPGQGGALTSQALNAQYDAANTGVNAAYDAARAAGPTSLPAYDAQAFAGNVKNALTDFDPRSIPRVTREVRNLQGLADSPTDPDINSLFAARTRLSNLRVSNDPVEATAAGRAVKAFDSSINDHLSEDLFRGDPDSVAKWKAAIGERREFGRLFQGDDLIEKLTAREPRGGKMQLAIDPHDATNYIFGRNGLGYVGQRNLFRDLARLKDVLGAASPSWNAIRAEAFSRFAQAGEGPIEAGSQQFSGVKFQKAWRAAMRQDPQLIDSLFSKDEIGTVNQFAGVAARVTAPVKGGDNPSNTAVASQALSGVMAAMKRLPFMALKSLPLIDHMGDALDNAVRVNAVKNATIRAAPRTVLRPASAIFGQHATAPMAGVVGTQRGQ